MQTDAHPAIKTEPKTPPPKPAGLKDSSNDPTLPQSDSQNSNSDIPVSAAPAKSSAKVSIYAPLRQYLAYSDTEKLFLDADDLEQIVQTVPAADLDADPAYPPTDLSAIFPDLPPLGLLDVPLAAAAAPEGRPKKSEKRADRDDPNKRVEETLYTKLFPIGKFMSTKPTLIGPLQPAKRWRDGRWLNADDCPASDSDTPPVKAEDSASGACQILIFDLIFKFFIYYRAVQLQACELGDDDAEGAGAAEGRQGGSEARCARMDARG
jgi:chromatin modification-related protein VID21